jgi:Phosphatidylserine synthase
MNPYNEFGRELHSLSSFISFGVAPAVAAWKTSFSGIGLVGYIILIAFPLCGAFRLAKKSISEVKEVKAGVPINIAGFLIVLDNLSVVKFGAHAILSIIFMLLLSYLMVSSYLLPSSIRTKKM